MTFWATVLAVLAANAITILAIYLIWAARYGHTASVAKNAGQGLLAVGVGIVRVYIALVVMIGLAYLLALIF